MFRADKKLDVREEDGVKKVDVTVKVDEGEQYTVHRIAFEGNTKTKDKVLRRAMIIKEGDVFRTDMFRESFTGISQLGYFDVKATDPKVDFVPDKPQVDITVRGEEAGINEVMFQGGYGSVFGFSLGAQFSTKNLGGGGQTLSLNYTIGQYQKNVSVSYTEPYLLDMPYSLTTSVSNSSVDYSASRVGATYAYKQLTRSFGTSLGTRLSTFLPEPSWAFFTTVGMGYNYHLIRIEGGQNYLYRNTNAQLTSSFSSYVTYNTVNHPFKPTSGQKVGLDVDYGGWQFGTDTPFLRTNLDYERVASITDRHIFALNASYGYINNLSGGDLPIWDLYRPGGENSIRGYRYGQVGSARTDNNLQQVVVGGNKQFIANLEYQFKVAEEFRTVFFYDMGTAWASGTKVFSYGLRRSAGIELRFFLPISPAPLRLIWARKLNPYEFDTTGVTDFQFSIGTTF
jgi:outer membrane protein insertion porin family